MLFDGVGCRGRGGRWCQTKKKKKKQGNHSQALVFSTVRTPCGENGAAPTSKGERAERTLLPAKTNAWECQKARRKRIFQPIKNSHGSAMTWQIITTAGMSPRDLQDPRSGPRKYLQLCNRAPRRHKGEYEIHCEECRESFDSIGSFSCG